MSSTSDPITARAVALAAHLHAGQTDDTGKPRLHHCLRVMMSLDEHGLNDHEVTWARCAAVLHHALSDSHDPGLAAEHIADGFGTQVIHAVQAVTRRRGEPYDRYLRRASDHPLARRVKIADLEDHVDPVGLAARGLDMPPRRLTAALGALLAPVRPHAAAGRGARRDVGEGRRLGYRERRILEMLLGLDGQRPRSHAQVAAAFELTVAQVREILHDAAAAITAQSTA